MNEKKIIPGTELPKRTDAGIDEQLYKPGKYEVTPDDDFTVDVSIKRQDDKRWIIVLDKKQADETHWVKFRMWTFSEEIELKKMATQYDPLKRIHLIDNDLLNRLKIQRLIKEWSFGENNPRLKLFHVNGVLTDESFKAIMGLHSNILRYIVERMNGVLEYNE